jgi:hypothetical protein
MKTNALKSIDEEGQGFTKLTRRPEAVKTYLGNEKKFNDM